MFERDGCRRQRRRKERRRKEDRRQEAEAEIHPQATANCILAAAASSDAAVLGLLVALGYRELKQGELPAPPEHPARHATMVRIIIPAMLLPGLKSWHMGL